MVRRGGYRERVRQAIGQAYDLSQAVGRATSGAWRRRPLLGASIAPFMLDPFASH